MKTDRNKRYFSNYIFEYILGYVCLLFFPVCICAQQEATTVLRNSGLMYIGQNTSNEPSLFIDGSFSASEQSDIHLEGKIVLGRDLINNVTSGNVFSELSSGTFEFRGKSVQQIYGSADKVESYIFFPNLIINNQTNVLDEAYDICAVFAEPQIGITVDNLNMQRGRFVLNSEVNSEKESDIAHLLVTGNVSYPNDNYEKSKHEKALMQVNLKFDNSIDGKLLGFTPPFRKIYSDYFLFNLVSKPTNKGVFGDIPRLIRTPKEGLLPGRGYLLGFGVVPLSAYQQNLPSIWSDAKPSDRISDCISLARDFGPKSLMQYVNSDGDIKDKYSDEILNIQDISVEIEEGWNYLGNPFTVPIDLRSLIEDPADPTEWGIDVAANLDRYYYILSDGKGIFTKGNTIDDPISYEFSTAFRLVNKVGSTTNSSETLVAPMQMFVIRKKTEGSTTMKIPASLRTHGEVGFKRSASIIGLVASRELLIEVEDAANTINDRATIVFRDEATSSWDDGYDAEKLFNPSRGNSQVYTYSEDNRKLAANVVPPSISQLTLCLRPPVEEKDVTIRAFRIESLPEECTVLLRDHFTGSTIDLISQPTYSFKSSPTDKEDRFTLEFSNMGTSLDNQEERSLCWVSYNNGLITIDGLNTAHCGKDVCLLDIQGRIILKDIVKSIPREQFNIVLETGIYILQIGDSKIKVSVSK